jgi:hypothetical protein
MSEFDDGQDHADTGGTDQYDAGHDTGSQWDSGQDHNYDAGNQHDSADYGDQHGQADDSHFDQAQSTDADQQFAAADAGHFGEQNFDEHSGHAVESDSQFGTQFGHESGDNAASHLQDLQAHFQADINNGEHGWNNDGNDGNSELHVASN